MNRKLVAIFVVLLALCGCTPSNEPETSPTTEPSQEAPAPPASYTLIRLTDRVADAEISSALQSPDRSPPKTKSLFVEDFEDFSFKDAHWQSAACVAAKATGSEGKALLYRGKNAHHCVFLVPVQPSSFVRLSRKIRASQSGVDLAVLETNVPLKHPGTRNHPADLKRVMGGKFVKMKELLFVHRFATPKIDQWQTHTLELLTTPQTKTLVLMIQDAEGVTRDSDKRVLIDALQVEQLMPNRKQRLSLLEQWARDPNDPTGHVKVGQLLPTRRAYMTKEPFDHNFDYRPSLFTPTPTTMSFSIGVPADGALSFSYALAKHAQPNEDVTFEVCITAGQKTSCPFKKTIAATPKTWHWHDARVELSTFSGKTIELALKTTSATQAALALWGNPRVHGTRPAQDKPNVLLFGIDTLRADRIHAYGYKRETSPHIDALAREGVLFKNTTSTANWTSPAFASIFTGLMPSTHQVIHRSRRIGAHHKTIGEHFRDNGWLTTGVAYKAYIYNMGFEQGFDRWFNVPDPDNRGDNNTKKALAWLDRYGSERFFMFLHYNDPHQPFNHPPEFRTAYADPKLLQEFGARFPMVVTPHGEVHGCRRCPTSGPKRETFRTMAHDLYDGAVNFLDAQVGEVVAKLKELGVYDSTIIGFVADHGEIMWEHGSYFGHGGRYMQEELIAVPMIIKPAGKPSWAGTVVDHRVSGFDMMPTLLELAGISFDASKMHARSLVPALQQQPLQAKIAISENIKQGMLALRNNPWKYVLDIPSSGPTRETLINLTENPRERPGGEPAPSTQWQTFQEEAARYLVAHRPGSFLLVTGPANKPYRLKFDGGAPRAWIGVTPQQTTAKSRVIFLGEVDPTQSDALRVTVNDTTIEPLALSNMSAAQFDTALEAADQKKDAIRVHLLSRNSEASQATLAVDAQQLETLRAMGYVE